MRPVTRRQAGHHAARSAATRAHVMHTLERLLDSGEAFSEISVQRILEEAGVSRATFYAHFDSKADVLARLTDELRESLLTLARRWDPGAEEGGPVRFVRFFEEVITIHRAHQGVLGAVREAAAYDPAVSDFYTAELDGFDETVRRTLRAEQAAGATPADVDVGAASRVIVWGGAQAIAHHLAVDDGSGDAALARELALIWWHGAYRRPAG
ncbi:TetR/AcrR family transcriptional regulator [Streptomyces justiciae]|uniref:TetR/AcrR family transcriptional regulator n=1 Tax=Streptomyces justiciae TaxID=2780140 RepID=UPI00187E5FE3|nr:TetR/AcrR family transcriptional regulator [Streptomyces justiciae]MBE8478478.1 TetR/AcrR family transcriptional regulator [Streptomyces justiciae]